MKRIVIGVLITVAALSAAVVESSSKFHGVSFTWQAFAFLAVALLPWLPDFIESVKYDKWELRLRNAEKKADAAIDLSLRGGGKKDKLLADKKNSARTAAVATTASAGDDPHAGRFGGKSEANGRRLTARIEEIPGEHYYRRIILRVQSTERSRPLRGRVQFHVHPTFETTVLDEPVSKGVAETSIVSYGVFTVGAEADAGDTRLELNLATLGDPDDPFFGR